MTDTESATAKLSNIFNNVGTIIGAIRPRITLKTKKKKNKAWFDRDCSALKRSVRDLARRISNRQANNELIKHYYNEKKRYKTLIRKKHRQYKAKILNDLVDLENQILKSSGILLTNSKMKVELRVRSQAIFPPRTGQVILRGC